MKYNVKNYLLKPIDEDELCQTLRNLHREILSEMKSKKERDLGIDAIAYNIIKSLLNGDHSPDICQQAMELFCIHADDPVYYAIIQYDDYINFLNEKNEMKTIDKQPQVKQLILAIIGEENKRNLLEKEYGFDIILTNNILDKYDMDINKLLHNVQKKINENEQISVSIFVGRKVNEISQLKESYTSSLIAMNYRFYRGKSCVVFYEKIKDAYFNYDIREFTSFPMLIEAIEKNRTEDIISVVDDMFSEFQNSFLALEVINIYLNSFVLEIMRIVSQMDGDIGDYVKELSILNREIKNITIADLKSAVVQFSLKSSAYIKSLRDRKSIGIIAEVKEYILKNYHNDITLKSIAEIFYLNPVYLGQLFKNNFGISFNDYLTNLRIDQAKKLLRRSDMKIYEIADRVGYRDPDYSINKFRQKVGMTPSHYRKSILEEEK